MVSTTTFCKSNCGVLSLTCDELGDANVASCATLENSYSCSCTGCECTYEEGSTEASVSTLKTHVSISQAFSTLPKTTTTTTTTTTTSIASTIDDVSVSEGCIYPAGCFGLSCDDWAPFGDTRINTRCSYLERVHDCDCGGCLCNDEEWSTTEPQQVSSTKLPTTATATTEQPSLNYGVDTSVVGGGYSNSATGKYSVISGGRANFVSQSYTCIAGGVQNAVRSNYAAIGGGYKNSVNGRFATITGGRDNSAAGRHTVLLGSGAATQGKIVDHVLVMNFKGDIDGSPVPTIVTTENTISLQADAIMFNDIDLLAATTQARRLEETDREIDLTKERISTLKHTLAERLTELRALL
jgi:hypothetical protein